MLRLETCRIARRCWIVTVLRLVSPLLAGRGVAAVAKLALNLPHDPHSNIVPAICCASRMGARSHNLRTTTFCDERRCLCPSRNGMAMLSCSRSAVLGWTNVARNLPRPATSIRADYSDTGDLSRCHQKHARLLDRRCMVSPAKRTFVWSEAITNEWIGI